MTFKPTRNYTAYFTRYSSDKGLERSASRALRATDFDDACWQANLLLSGMQAADPAHNYEIESISNPGKAPRTVYTDPYSIWSHVAKADEDGSDS